MKQQSEESKRANYKGLGPDLEQIGLDCDGFPYTVDPSIQMDVPDELFGDDGYGQDVRRDQKLQTMSAGEQLSQTIYVPGIGSMNVAQFFDYNSKKAEWLAAGNVPHVPDPISVYHERKRSGAADLPKHTIDPADR